MESQSPSHRPMITIIITRMEMGMGTLMSMDLDVVMTRAILVVLVQVIIILKHSMIPSLQSVMHYSV
jgi:hypothetical protein